MSSTPRMWAMDAYPEVYEDIAMDEETITGRAADPRYSDKDFGKMKDGDVIQFNLVGESNSDIPLMRRVDYIKHYKNDDPRTAIENMLEIEGWKNMEPRAGSLKNAVKSYFEFPGYEARIREHGVYAISLDNIDVWDIFLPKPLFLEFLHAHRTVEGRSPDFENPKKDYRNMRRGDIARLFNRNNTEFFRWIKFVHLYKDVEDMLNAEGLEGLVPGYTLEQGVELYDSLPGYSDRIPKYGMAAIGFGTRVPSEIISYLNAEEYI